VIIFGKSGLLVCCDAFGRSSIGRNEDGKYIESAGIDMVVVTSIDRHGLDRAIFGDIAEEITRNSPVPVTTVNPYVTETAQVQRPGEIRPVA
jgi:hypothetical protein